jgi:hypothetical protein
MGKKGRDIYRLTSNVTRKVDAERNPLCRFRECVTSLFQLPCKRTRRQFTVDADLTPTRLSGDWLLFLTVDSSKRRLSLERRDVCCTKRALQLGAVTVGSLALSLARDAFGISAGSDRPHFCAPNVGGPIGSGRI